MREFLKGLDLDKETIDTIMAEHGKLLTEEKEKNQDLKDKIEELNKKIKENSEIDIEALKKEQFDLGKAEGEKEVETFKKENALEKALGNFKAKDIKLLSKLIDNEKIKYEEEDGKYNVSGLQEQIDEIKKTHDYLFEVEKEPKQQPRINTGEQHSSTPKSEPTTLIGALREKYNK